MNERICFTTAQAQPALRALRVGLNSLPYLADHGFQDMVVLPGSFYIEKALAIEREVSGGIPASVRNVIFQNPVILSAEDTVITVEVRDHEYIFRDAEAGQCVARLEIDRTGASSANGEKDFSIETFKAQSCGAIDSTGFYKKLRENGNQYGRGFQRVSSVWRAGNQSLGKLASSGAKSEFDATFLDSVTQLIGSLSLEKGKTFILRSIDKLNLIDTEFPDTLWGHAILVRDDQSEQFLGDVRVIDESGKCYLEFCGVAFSLLQRVDAADEKAATRLVVAANFTAEPIEDSLKFWSDYFGVSTQIELAPYNQIFQQLLDPASAFRKNQNGVNIVLLSPEEWTRNQPTGDMLDKERLKQSFGDRATYRLPNGLQILHLNQYETDYVYKEVFEDQCYLRHGIHLPDGATVVDIGANIGLFSLFVMSRCADPRIYAFEPAPVVHELLKANCEAYGSNVRAFNAGVADKSKTATFTFYEKSSVFSGFHSDEAEDREAIQTIVRNMLKSDPHATESLDEYVGELTADRLRSSSYECRLMSVSDIIRDNQIEKIDLLKIDAEKSELDILRGIDDRDWPKIKQVVMEIHDRTGETAKRIEQLLVDKGFHCALEEETLLEHSGLFNLYATRSDSQQSRNDPTAAVLKRNVQDFCVALSSFMTDATAPLILCLCPKSPTAEPNAALKEAEETLLSEARKIRNVQTISAEALQRRYPVKDYYDPDTHRGGHIPYTPQCYAAIGTAVTRSIVNLRANRFKVIALDCDNTLWKGVCGEDGSMGVQVAPPYRALQEFMVAQMNAGMLLCLCSKNNEKDAVDVFDQRNDMPLKREHLVSWRLNWKSKSENIKSLAKELNVGLDTFIFIDDNPVDCADVRINCPGALTLQLPQNPESFATFFEHVWAFDRAASSQEDQSRTRMYRENAEREQLRERSISLKNFIDGLQLRVEVGEPREDQIARISQLTFRTNQFNFTTIRRSETEIRDFLLHEGNNGLVVRVADRFGDYGLVGLVLYHTTPDRYNVDTFLLSCRVLGRGVEHAVVSALGKQALNEGRRFVEIKFWPTEKNLPALEFVTRIGNEYRDNDGTSWTFPAESLAAVQYNPDEGAPQITTAEKVWHGSALADNGIYNSERLQRIAEELCDSERLGKAIEEYRRGRQPAAAAPAVSGDATESALLNIWRRVLALPAIGLNDNFFEAGGTSLRAVQVIAMIKKELKQNLSIVSLFECPTVSLLAAKLKGAASPESNTGNAAARGQRRRYNMGGRPSPRAAA